MSALSQSSSPPAGFRTGRLSPDQWDEAAQLIHGSLSAWYAKNLNQPGRFGADWVPFRIFPEVYESLDPGCAVTAVDAGTGALTGICFYHPRPHHISVGIVATCPQSGSRGLAKALLQEVLALADETRKPVRLVSSLMNLDSFSLYTRLGFVPGTVFQDMQFPEGKLPPLLPEDGECRIRPAAEADIPALTAFEKSRSGLDRQQDFQYLLVSEPLSWPVLVAENSAGQVTGYLASVDRTGTRMLGPGLAADDRTALGLIAAQLHHHAPHNPVFLVPVKCQQLVAALYAAGARNLELHTAQVRDGGHGGRPEADGVVIPTFMPESG